MAPRRRGPRRHLRTGREGAGPPILMPELLGTVLIEARSRAGLRQAHVAEQLRVPQSGISKLERGVTTLSLYHLDRYAETLEWTGWELYRRASTLADLLAEEGKVVWWEVPEEVGGDERVRRRMLRDLVRDRWNQADGLEREQDFDALSQTT